MAIQPGLGAQGIAANWGAPPELRAVPLGEMVRSILADKLAREKQLRDAVSDTIGNVRGEIQSNAYLEAMKAAGLVPEGYDAGGVGGAKYGTGLAKMIQDKREADALEAYRNETLGISKGHLGIAQQRAQMAQDWMDTADTGDTSQFYIDPDTGLRMQRTAKGPKLAPLYAQPDVAPQQTAKQEAVRPIYEQRVDEATKAAELKKKLEDRFGAYGTEKGKEGFEDPRHPGVPLVGGKKARVDAKYIKRIEAEKEAKKREAELLKKYPGLAAPEPAPAETGDTLPTSKVQPTTGGADKNLAPGYGVPPVGTIRNGYKFKGGDPKDQTNWEPI